MMAQSRAESTRDTYNYGQYLNQFPPNTIKVIREFERIQKSICRHKMSIMFNEICIYIYIYIYIFVCVCVYRTHKWHTPMDPLHGRVKVGRPAKNYIQQICADKRCSLEDLPETMDDREGWRERVRDICAGGVTWWWWCVCMCAWLYIYIYIYTCVCV